MNLDELQSVQSRERQTDSLQQLRESFYREAGRFIAQLREERERAAERADDPFDAPEVQRLSDDIETAERTVEAIYERRIGKLVKQASLEAAGMAADASGLTAEEQEVFERLVDTIETNRERVLDGVVAGDPTSSDDPGSAAGEAGSESGTGAATGVGADPDPPVDPAEDDTAREVGEPPDTVEEPIHDAGGAGPDLDTEPDVSAADVMGGEREADDSGDRDGDEDRDHHPVEPAPDPRGADRPPAVERSAPSDAGADADAGAAGAGSLERTTVRITRDVGEILGVDERAYDLSSEDVVTLPTPNAEPLLEQDAAERLD
ncbi:hypothetical protein BRC94_00160 [Halobacteriales archaeon QS_5_70_17]|nr:MAG: hypothetical protein BRC94_00160 [Halobacteriales archaeon QS_5_70_17]